MDRRHFVNLTEEQKSYLATHDILQMLFTQSSTVFIYSVCVSVCFFSLLHCWFSSAPVVKNNSSPFFPHFRCGTGIYVFRGSLLLPYIILRFEDHFYWCMTVSKKHTHTHTYLRHSFWYLHMIWYAPRKSFFTDERINEACYAYKHIHTHTSHSPFAVAR